LIVFYISVKAPDELYECSKEAQESRASTEKSRIAGGESVRWLLVIYILYTEAIVD
jgi:hypothetical protein